MSIKEKGNNEENIIGNMKNSVVEPTRKKQYEQKISVTQYTIYDNK